MRLLWWLPVGSVPEVAPAELKRWLDEGRPLQLADARTAMEYQQGTIGQARHAPVTEMPASLECLQLDPNIPVVMLCLSGHRSLPGTRWLLARGYKAYSLQGGIMNWNKTGYKLNSPSFAPKLG